jgi:Flp pilus assembly protein TadG
MKQHMKLQKGQALVIIALAIFGIIALTALAIDGGNAFADRRQAQNAADAAALAASMRYAQDQTLSDTYLTTLAIDRTSINGYDNTAPRSSVVLTKTAAGVADCPVGSTGYFFQVDIDSFMPTWFGKVVGISEVHNHVTSKTVGCAPHKESAFEGNTIVILHPTECKALTINGTFVVNVTSTTGNGIFVNSNCVNPPNNGALYFQNGSVTSPSVSVVGNIYGQERFVVPPTVINNPVAPIERNYAWPTTDEICPASMAFADVVSGQPDTLNPGKYPGAKPAWSNKVFPPAGITKLNPGTYCLSNGFKTTNSDVLTGDGVTIVMVDSTIDIPGGTIHLTAPTTGDNKGLLMYVPKTNPNNYDLIHPVIQINGNGTSFYSGSIVAPYGNVSLNGTGSSTSIFRCQLIAWTLKLGGGGILDFNYDKNEQWEAPLYAGIELLK